MTRRRKFLVFTTLLGLLVAAYCVVYVLYREISYSAHTMEIREGTQISGPDLSFYYIRMDPFFAVKDTMVFDRANVPIILIDGEWHYHPVYISQFALGAYEHYLNTKDRTALSRFIDSANWLRESLRKHGDFYYWEYTFEYPVYPGLDKVPWFSAMAQGEGVSVLLRAYVETKDETYLRAAQKGLRPILSDVSSGGASVMDGDGYVFPQEYSSTPPSSVLNGAIFAFFGVYDYYRVTGDPATEEISESILATFSKSIDQFDTGYWSLYSLEPRQLASPHYNSVHIAQLKVLAGISNDNRFLTYSKKFEDYERSRLNRLRYVLNNHLRQVREFTWEDVFKLPGFFSEHLWGMIVLPLWNYPTAGGVNRRSDIDTDVDTAAAALSRESNKWWTRLPERMPA
jgi:heparosan-N-sulfate-glucuronate 5-epimerase